MFSSVLQVGSLFSVPGDAALKIGNRVFKLLRRSGPGVGIPRTRNHPPFRHKSLEGSIRTGTGYRPKQSSPRFAASPLPRASNFSPFLSLLQFLRGGCASLRGTSLAARLFVTESLFPSLLRTGRKRWRGGRERAGNGGRG